MTAYRIEVRSGGQTGRLLSQGSGFALRSDALGTAYHVIGKPERRRLFHEGFEAVSYWAMGFWWARDVLLARIVDSARVPDCGPM